MPNFFRQKAAPAIFLLIATMTVSGCGDIIAMFGPKHELVVQADAEELNKLADKGVSADTIMDKSVEVFYKRLLLAYPGYPEVTRQGTNRIKMVIPEVSDLSAVEKVLLIRGKLEIKLVDMLASPEELATGKARFGSEVLPFAGYVENISVRRSGRIDGENVASAHPMIDESGEPAVTISFDDIGREKFARLTSKNVGSLIAIVFDDTVLAAPTIREPITEGTVLISGQFSSQEADNLARTIRTGQLPLKFELVQSRKAE